MSATAAVVAAMILDRPLCVPCLYDRSGMLSGEVDAALTALTGVLKLQRGVDRCRACGTTGQVVSIARPRL